MSRCLLFFFPFPAPLALCTGRQVEHYPAPAPGREWLVTCRLYEYVPVVTWIPIQATRKLELTVYAYSESICTLIFVNVSFVTCAIRMYINRSNGHRGAHRIFFRFVLIVFPLEPLGIASGHRMRELNTNIKRKNHQKMVSWIWQSLPATCFCNGTLIVLEYYRGDLPLIMILDSC